MVVVVRPPDVIVRKLVLSLVLSFVVLPLLVTDDLAAVAVLDVVDRAPEPVLAREPVEGAGAKVPDWRRASAGA